MRVIIALVVVLALAPPLVVLAQPPAAKVPRIAVLGNEDTPPWEGFRQGMRELGYVDGRTVKLEWRWSDGKPDRLPALAAELVALKPDVIVASSTQAIRAAKQATQTIPIVMAISAYPERIGLVESLARPGGNVTGLTNVAPELQGKRLELLKEIAPRVSRLAFFWNPASPVEPHGMRDMQAAASAAGIDVLSVEVRIFEERLFVDAGGLLSYAPSFIEMFRRAATFVDRILKGARPADLPVEQPTKFDLVVNGRTARQLGLTPSPSLLLRADQVIE